MAELREWHLTPNSSNEPTAEIPEKPARAKSWTSHRLETYDQVRKDFAQARQGELRAALSLLSLTGLVPRLRDTDGLQGACDILLIGEAGSVEVAEVTSTIESRDTSDYLQSERLAQDIEAAYRGASTWLLHLQYGWRMPANTRSRRKLAARIAEELEGFDLIGRRDGELASASQIHARRGAKNEGSVRFVSWSANIPDGQDVPYLDRLSEFLATDLIQNKLLKLQRDGKELGAARQHLYVLLATSGAYGGLLLNAPQALTLGEFAPPAGFPDLWLDGGSKVLYHWNSDDGWVVHRL